MATHPRHRRATAAVALTAALALPVVSAVSTGNTWAAASGAIPSCAPWQTLATVSAGEPLTPRVFPTATGAGTLKPPTAGRSLAPSTSQRPAKPAPPRVVCRNAPPLAFPQPGWSADTVVGGPELAATGEVVHQSASVPPPPAVYDVSYVLADLQTGDILAAKSPHAWLRPASTLKILTALTLLPRLDPRRVVVASEEAQEANGSRVGILAGNRYPVSSLVDAMLMLSANDAVYALADAAGGYDGTVRLMNQQAREIGAFDTLVVDPSGLDEGNQRSSAYDLALAARAAMKLPGFRAAVVKRDATFPGGKDAQGKVWKPFHLYNINELLSHYPGAIGIKPGRTDRAQHTFVGAATRGGRTLLVAQMGSITGSWKPTAALLDWGFAHADDVVPVGRLVDPGGARPPVAITSGPEPLSPAGGAAPASTATSATTGTVIPPSTRESPDLALGSSSQGIGGPVGSAPTVWGLGLLLAAAAAVTVALRKRRRTKDHLG